MRSIFGQNIHVRDTGHPLTMEQITQEAEMLVASSSDYTCGILRQTGHRLGPGDAQANPERRAHTWGLNPMRLPQERAPITPLSRAQVLGTLTTKPPPPRRPDMSAEAQLGRQTPKNPPPHQPGRAPMLPGPSRAQALAAATSKHPPPTGRGRIGVPSPVLPYNDVGNDPYLNKSQHNNNIE